MTRHGNQLAIRGSGAAALSGIVLGLYLALPGYLSEPVYKHEPQFVSAIDPNLARYQEVLAAEGISATPYVLAAYSAPPPSTEAAPSSAADDGTAFDAWLAQEEAAAREERRQWEQEREQAHDAQPYPVAVAVGADPAPEQAEPAPAAPRPYADDVSVDPAPELHAEGSASWAPVG